MNALDWSRDRAIACMKENAIETDTQIRSESLGYSCDMPGQALAYKMGAMKIVELRERARLVTCFRGRESARTLRRPNRESPTTPRIGHAQGGAR